MPNRFTWYLSLARASNLPTIWTNAIAAWALAGGGWNLLAWLWLALAGSLLYAGGCTLNDAFDAAWDREHRPERAIPSGALSAREVWLVGSLELLGGLAVLVHFGWLAVASGAGVVVAILLYDWLHKKSPWAVVCMGWCRAQWVLTAAWAAALKIEPLVAFYALTLFVFILTISLIARRESLTGAAVGNRAETWLVRILDNAQSVFVLFVVLKSLDRGLVYLKGLLALLAYAGFRLWCYLAAQPMKTHGKAAIGNFVARALAGIVLLDAAFACLAWGWSGLWLVVCWPLCLLLQRRIAAT